MKLFRSTKEPSYRSVDAHMGAANVISPDVIGSDPSAGPGISLSDIPDFSAIAEKQIASIKALPTFHQSGAGYYFPEIKAACLAYCHKLGEEFTRFEDNLDNTYRNGLIDKRDRIKAQLKDMGLEEPINSA